ncbi:MAG: recombinase family protein [Chloroflexota bacterium]|nr:recombinase family protein [Chloroflexota bacterium]
MDATQRCVIYCRVSSDEQARGYSLPTQEASCRRYCADRGYEIVGVYHDAHSGTELDRPGLNATIESVAALCPAVVLLHDVDRLGRELIVQAIAERELTRHGARVEYVLGGGTDTADGVLLKGVKQALAVYENYQRVERSRRGKDGRIRAGGVMVAARPAYGYRYVPGDRTGALVPDPDEAPIVARMFAWCADEGLTTYEIAKRLCAEGVPTRADTNPGVVRKRTARHFWDPHTVARILRNETHKGVWHWNKTRRVKRGDRVVQEPRPREDWLTLAVPAIVDDAIWERAQGQLDRNKTTARRNAKREYLLRGLVTCPSCGRRWTGRYKNHLGRAYYRCPTTEGEPWRNDCTAQFGIEQGRLESGVLAAVKSFLLDPAARAASVGSEQARLATERDRLAADLVTVDRHLADVERKLGALLDDALTSGFPGEIVDRRKRDLLAERERRVRERAQALASLATTDTPDVEAAIAALAPTVERAFAEATPAELRRLLDVLRVEVRVLDRTTARLTGVVGGVEGSVVELSPWSRR